MKLEMRANNMREKVFTLESCSDADFAADKGDRKSLTGNMVLFNGMPVSWSAKKQGGVSLSTMEAEFVAASESARELLGICTVGAHDRRPVYKTSGPAQSVKAPWTGRAKTRRRQVDTTSRRSGEDTG